jgi:Concanavalin A-like lectin/glucanases superfamily
MSAAMGRISGNLLANNLTRNGVDLKFSNTGISDTVLYLGGANNRKIGIGSESPLSELYVYNASGSNTNSTNFLVDTLSTFQNTWTVTSNTISYPIGTINVVPSPAPATITDISTINSTIVNTGNAIYSSNEPGANPDYGSVRFTGSNSLSVALANQLSLGTAAYTVEGWFYYGTIPTGGCFFGKWDSTLGLEYKLEVSSAVQMTWYTRNTTSSTVSVTFTSPTANAWHHFAAVRTDTTVNVFIDGVVVGTTTFTGDQAINTGAPFTIGGRDNNTNNINAYITYIRIVPGTALYSTNFIPQTSLTAVTGTKFLLQAKGPTGTITSSGMQGGNVAVYGPTNTIQSGGAATYPSSTPDQDINLTPIGTFTATLTNPSGNLITLTQNTNTIQAGYPIKFSGTAFGSIVLGQKYYVLEVVDTSHITITETPGGNIFNVTSDAGTMTATVYGVMSLTAPSSTIYGSMHSTGDISLDGNIALGIVSLNGINSSLIPPPWHYVDGVPSDTTYHIGDEFTLWRNTYFGTTYGNYNVSNVSIAGSTNTISNTAPNTDLTLKANGTGGLFVGDLKFSQNDISNIKSNPANDAESSITLVPNGTGIFNITGTNAVQLAYGNDYNPYTISAPTSVAGNSASWPYNVPTLNGAVGSWSGTGTSIDGVTLYVTSYQKAAAFYSDNGHFIPYTVPVGLANSPGTFSYISKTGRTLSQLGEIRLNSKYNIYEGYQPSGLVSFTNLWDTTRTTFVTPEITPGAADNTLRFNAGGNLIATVDTSKLYATTFATGTVGTFGNPAVTFTANRVAIGSADVTVNPTSGNLNINTGTSSQLVLTGGTIPNTLNSAFTISATGTGYIKFTGTGGIVIPYGNNSTRPSSPEQGTVRYNTIAGAGEVFSATNGWIPVSGISPVLSSSEVYEVMEFWSIVLG